MERRCWGDTPADIRQYIIDKLFAAAEKKRRGEVLYMRDAMQPEADWEHEKALAYEAAAMELEAL